MLLHSLIHRPYFNPRSSCEERLDVIFILSSMPRFQSTLLMRGATSGRQSSPHRSSHFNPRSSCEERPSHPLLIHRENNNFNPRSSCEERPCRFLLTQKRNGFQSTLLMRGATGTATATTRASQDFNPRSSCEERRARYSTTWTSHNNFNPRSSCEERPHGSMAPIMTPKFQSTLLMRGATIRGSRRVVEPS